ncbi:MAG: type VII secretion integral membrane protein EccD [Pseudonocardiaceae bacterium]
MTVLAPRTRVDLALPSDVAVADLLPLILGMAGETAPDGGSTHGGWCLATLGGEPLDADRPLGSSGVVDGDLLQLRHRGDNSPAPLFDDVVEAIAVATPGSFRPWTEHTARMLGMIAAGLALLAAAVALLRAGPGLGVAVIAGVSAVLVLVAGAVIARGYGEARVGVLVAGGSLPLGFISGLYIVPGGVHAENLLLACVLALVLATVAIMVLGDGITPFVTVATAAAHGALAFLVATLLGSPAAGIAAGAAAVALGAISGLPRLTIQLSRLPMPLIPSSAQDLRLDPGSPDYAVIERRSGLAHEYLTGMIIGSGAVAATGAVLAATGGALGVVLAVVVAAVLLLRARSYVNASQAIALLVSGMVAVGGLVAGLLVAGSGQLVVFAGLLAVAMLALFTGVVLPRRRFSPVLRRSVDVIEATLIASVLPLALGVMDLYNTFRAL